MHERSLVRNLLHQIQQIKIRNNASDVDRVTVEIGPLSGVEKNLIRIAFNEMAGKMQLVIIEAPLTIACLQCDQSCDLTEFIFRCESCGSGRVKVIRGDEFRLISVTLTEETTHAQ